MLPRSNEPEDVRLSKLDWWDDLIFNGGRQVGMKESDYIPLFRWQSLPTWLEKQLDEIAEENRKWTTDGLVWKKFKPRWEE
jgi:hypothetical protein